MSKEPESPEDPLHISNQRWVPDLRGEEVYLVGHKNGTTVLKMECPDRDTCLFMAGYIATLQSMHLERREAERKAKRGG